MAQQVVDCAKTMREPGKKSIILLAFAVGSAALVAPAATANDSSSATEQCSLGRHDGASNNTVRCDLGFTPEQLRNLANAEGEDANASSTGAFEIISKRLGVTEKAAKAMLRIAGGVETLDPLLADVLTKVTKDYKRLQDQMATLTSESPLARTLIEEARAEIDVGRFAHARTLLFQATEAQLNAAVHARDETHEPNAASETQMFDAARTKSAEADVALTQRRYSEAAELFGQAASYVSQGKTREHYFYEEREADAFARLGEEQRVPGALQVTIALCRKILAELPPNNAPLEWATTQNTLGNALATLGDRENNLEHLKEAVTAYRAALEERTRARVPLDWAMTQNNLGLALTKIGGRESGTIRLEEAVEAYRDALKERTHKYVPLSWAMTQSNLGNALRMIGERATGTAHLEEAIVAYRAALEERTRESMPFNWAKDQWNMTQALKLLGERQRAATLTQKSIPPEENTR